MHFEYNVEGGDFTNAGTTSSVVKKMMKQLGVDMGIVKRTVVALYEAEVNIVAHAYRGVIYVDLEEDHVCIRLVDEGPGIPDIAKAMQKGYSTASPQVREMGFGAGSWWAAEPKERRMWGSSVTWKSRGSLSI